MKRMFRLTRTTDFKRVRRRGKSFAHPLIILIYTEGLFSGTRIGVSAGKSVGNAVKRNRAKRRIRACIDRLLCGIKPGYDLIIIGRKPVLEAEFGELERAMKILLSKAGLLEVDKT